MNYKYCLRCEKIIGDYDCGKDYCKACLAKNSVSDYFIQELETHPGISAGISPSALAKGEKPKPQKSLLEKAVEEDFKRVDGAMRALGLGGPNAAEGWVLLGQAKTAFLASLNPFNSNLEVVGQRVVYTAHHGETEEGVVTSWNDRFVFVRYGSKKRSEATDRSQLRVR